jgi:hypothetical protein
VTGRATWTSSAPDVATVSNGVVSGLAVGETTITASVGGLTDTSLVTVTPTNEPAGYTRFTEHFFNTVTNSDSAGTGRWGSNGGLTIVSDPTAPRSPPNVGQFTYPAGFHAGSAPGSIEFDNLAGASELYLSFWMKLSSNFQGEGSETNKVLFVWVNSQPAVFLSNEGSGSSPLVPTLRYQGNVDSREYFRQNVGSQQAMTRGVWRRWEVVLIANTGGQANGVMRWWIDGKKVGEYTDVRFRSGAQPFQYVSLQPIWGGVDGTVASTQYLWIDHLYVSGRS